MRKLRGVAMKNLVIFLLSFACVSISSYAGQWNKAAVKASSDDHVVALSCSAKADRSTLQSSNSMKLVGCEKTGQ